MNKYAKVIDWIKSDYTPLKDDWLFFNVSITEAGTAGINSVQNERELDTFIDGTRRVEFLFSLVLGDNYNVTTDEHNLGALQEFENFSQWVEEKNNEQSYPDFGNKVKIEQVEALDTAPNVIVDGTKMIAKYQGQFKITYTERR